MTKLLFSIFTIAILSLIISAQTEILSNKEIIEMSAAGISKDVIIQKVKTTGDNYDVSVKGLIELKKAGVDDDVINVIVEKSKINADSSLVTTENKTKNSADSLNSARTISIQKNSLYPSLQSLEKELLNLPDWKKLNLAITEDKSNADLSIQISYVHLTLLTRRYVYRIFDRRSGLIITAGETTAWGSLSNNLANNITKSLNKILEPNK